MADPPVDTLIVNYFTNPLFTTSSLCRARPFLNRLNETRCNSLFQTSTWNLGGDLRDKKNRSCVYPFGSKFHGKNFDKSSIELIFISFEK